MNLHDIRNEYKQQLFDVNGIAPSPIDQFAKWFNEATAANVPEANAMTLATATRDGIVSARMVLLKGFDEHGFCFYTNYESNKGKTLAENPNAALLFFWQPLERQVRIEGRVHMMTVAEADDYWQRRPVASRLGALASPQSRTIPGRAFLESNYKAFEAKYNHGDIPRPQYWGGFRVSPIAIEFWQGRPGRLHDRILYSRIDEERWKIERLAP